MISLGETQVLVANSLKNVGCTLSSRVISRLRFAASPLFVTYEKLFDYIVI
jgi:hypothetical protein